MTAAKDADRIAIMMREYDILNTKVSDYAKRNFQIFVTIGTGASLFAWYTFNKPQSVGVLSLTATIALHAITILLLHNYFVLLVLKQAMRRVADQVNDVLSAPVLTWEEGVWSRIWGGLDPGLSFLTWAFFALVAVPLAIAYFFLGRTALAFLDNYYGPTLAGSLYVGLLMLAVTLELVVPLMLRARLRTSILGRMEHTDRKSHK